MFGSNKKPEPVGEASTYSRMVKRRRWQRRIGKESKLANFQPTSLIVQVAAEGLPPPTPSRESSLIYDAGEPEKRLPAGSVSICDR